MFAISYPSTTYYKNGVAFPEQQGHPVYEEFLQFQRDGGTVQVLQDEPAFPRIEVSAWQLVQALAKKGWLQDVESAVNASTDPLVKYGWQRAPTFYSDQELTMGLAAAIGKTRAQLQELFELAASYKA